MKSKLIFKEPLLFSQEEIAMFLGVTRSQWAMYTLGQRDLSAKAKMKLEVLLSTINEVSFVKRQKLEQETLQEGKRQKILVRLLQENKLKQLQLQKKVTYMERRYQEALNTLHFAAILQTKKEGSEIEAVIIKGIQDKANAVLELNGLHQQEGYKIKLEMIRHEEKLLKKRKQKLR